MKIFFYSALLYLILPFVVLRLLWRSIKAPDYRRRILERFAFFHTPAKFQHTIWLHAVSVGEILSAIPLIRSLRKQYPQNTVVITTATPTGSACVKSILGSEVFHIYSPYDLPDVVKRFLNKINPKIAIIMETEIWPNLLHECHQRSIPIFLANARISQKSMRYYSWFKGFISPYLQYLSVIAPQSQLDADRFLQLGVPVEKIQLLGNIKFDLRPPEHIEEQSRQLRNQLGENRFIWIAASTHEGEETLILSAYRMIKTEIRDALLILVPRHPERFHPVAQLCQSSGFTVIKHSANQPCDEHTDIYLGDGMGKLMLLYAVSNIAYVGGSLVPVGGHNLLEPALFHLPILTGPYTANFEEINQLFQEKHAKVLVHDEKELAQQIIKFFHDAHLRQTFGENAYQIVQDNRGSVEKHLEVIKQLFAHSGQKALND